MFEKVNAGHPDKMADRLAGAVVDLVYERAGGLTKANPRVACEVMAGHGRVDVQIETSLGRLDLRADDLDPLIHRLFGERVDGNVLIAPQDPHLSDNQSRGLRCGDNGIFKGCPPTEEQRVLTAIAATMWERFKSDGKYIIDAKVTRNVKSGWNSKNPHELATIKWMWDNSKEKTMTWDEWVKYCERERVSYEMEYLNILTICQSNATAEEVEDVIEAWDKANDNMLSRQGRLWRWPYMIHNPLGPWTGGIDVDCGCTNRKLGSDMGDGVTGGGLMGKDLSKADVSVNIVCFLKAVASGQVVTACCSIGDESVTFTYADGRTETERFADIVEQARLYILTDHQGSFERFAMWGLIAPPAL